MLTIVADLLLTDSFLIKGRIEGKYARLSKVLDAARCRFVALREATLVDLQTRERITTPRLHVNLDEILLAHELVDSGGDLYQRSIAQDRALVEIRAFHAGQVQIEIAGLVRPGAYELGDVTKRFFVMEEPRLRGIQLDHEDLSILQNLPYVIVNKNRLAYIYDFEDVAR